MSTINAPQAEIHLVAACLDCRKKHEYRATPATWLTRMEEWRQKHLGHRIEFRSPGRRLPRGLDDRRFERAGRAPWWLDEFASNADMKLAYGASAALTITLASLATSATLVAGRQSTAVSNSANLYLDVLVDGDITTGTSPTAARSIRVYTYGSITDTPAYPDTMTGTDGAATVTSTDIRDAALPLLAVMATSATSNIAYPFRATSLALAYGGVMPRDWGVWVVHETVVALNATGGNHRISYKPAYVTSA